MAFTEGDKFRRATAVGWKCECTRYGCGHNGRCNSPLLLGRWHAHHRTSALAGGSDTIANMECLCIPCHENTASYGRS